MVNKLSVKKRQMEKMGIKKNKSGDYEYIEKKDNDKRNDIIASPLEMQKGIEEIMGVKKD